MSLSTPSTTDITTTSNTNTIHSSSSTSNKRPVDQNDAYVVQHRQHHQQQKHQHQQEKQHQQQQQQQQHHHNQHQSHIQSDAKKARYSQLPPSRVLHFRALPKDVSESEIVGLGLVFGPCIRCLIMRNKAQAFLEMSELSYAIAMFDYYTTVPLNVRGKQCFIGYSSHQELSSGSGAHNVNDGGDIDMTWNATVLLVDITEMHYPVTIDVLHQIFSRHGSVLRIIIFVKNNEFKALVEFDEPAHAYAARSALDGQHIYTGSCQLNVKPSKQQTLVVKYNGEKSRDYTNQSLPKSSSGSGGGGSGGGGGGGGNYGALLQQQQQPQHIQPSSMNYLRSNYVHGGAPHGHGAPLLYDHSSDSGVAAGGMSNVLGSGFVDNTGSILIISNLNAGRVTCNDLFMLVGVYADVIRVKIMYNKKDTALVQVADSQQATTAICHLRGCMLYGTQMQVNLSRHGTVNMPKPGVDVDEEDLTQDFSGSPIHRFRYAGSKIFSNIFPPSAVLHISNIPDGTTEEMLRETFFNQGHAFNGFKFFNNNSKMALITFYSVEKATHALIAFHYYRLLDKNLRISFSKQTTLSNCSSYSSSYGHSGFSLPASATVPALPTL